MPTVYAFVASTSLLACLAHTVDPKAPIYRVQESRIQEERQVVRGTATLVIESDENNAPRITVVHEDTSAITIVQSEPADYDANTNLVTVSLAIRNKSRLRLIEAAAFGVAKEGRPLENLASGSSGNLEIADHPDTVTGVDLGSLLHVWGIAQLTSLPAATWRGSVGLRTDSISLTRGISFRLPTGANRFEVPLVAVAGLRLEVPAVRPNRSPDSIIARSADSSLIVPHPQSKTSRIYRDWFWLAFDRQLSRERRQEVVDKVDGVAVGGMELGDNYLIQLPPETTIESLQQAIATVASEPGVVHAKMVVILHALVPQYLKSVDDTAYRGRSIGTAWAVPDTPLAQTNEMAAMQQQRLVMGTASLNIHDGDSRIPDVRVLPRDTSAIAIIVAGEPEYDEATRQLRVSLAIRNKSRLRLIEPAAIGIRDGEDSLKNRLSASGEELAFLESSDSSEALETIGTALHVKNVELAPDTDKLWLGSVGLRSGSHSIERPISLILPVGPGRFEVPLVAVAALRLDVPAQSPEGSPDSVIVRLEDSSLIAPHPRYGSSRIRREYFWIRFARDVSQERRQEIVDQVDGVVVGGMRALGDQYLVQLAPGSSVESLQRAVATVASQTGVARADFYVEMRPLQPQYQEPTDASASHRGGEK